jgi:hypothetical protein
MPHEVHLTAQAWADIWEFLAWLTPKSPVSASRWRDALLERILTLRESPERWPLAHEGQAYGIEVRELLFRRRQSTFRILFKIEGTVVNIVHVRRAARDWLKPRDFDD